jgi:hypothetical protein
MIPRPNLSHGVAVTATSGLKLGGSSPEERNLISGNGVNGIHLQFGATAIFVAGNYVGTDRHGTDLLFNASNALAMESGAHGNTIGSTIAGGRNLFAGSYIGSGIVLSGPSVTGNVIQGNFIGTDSSGTIAIPNSSDGVSIYEGAHDNIIGGTAPGAGNIIAFNYGHGIQIYDAIENAIIHNSVFENVGLGISLTSGGNNHQAAPAVKSAVVGGGNTNIIVGLFSTPNTTFGIDLFSSAVCDPSGYGEGATFLTSASLTTNAAGRGRKFVVLDAEVPVGRVITATATSPTNDTSEFSPCFPVTAGAAPGGYGDGLIRLPVAARIQNGEPTMLPVARPAVPRFSPSQIEPAVLTNSDEFEPGVPTASLGSPLWSKRTANTGLTAELEPWVFTTAAWRL